MTRAPRLEDYTIVLLCPLVVEQQAACLMLDEIHDGVPERSDGQTVLYTLGRIGRENVAIAGYPVGEVGIGLSGSMVAEVLRDFPNIKYGLLVGIAAGIPSSTRDIRLGDVAVAVPGKDNSGVVGYDLVKVEEGGVRLKQWQNATHPLLRSAITSFQVHESRAQQSFMQHLRVLDDDQAAMFRRPCPPPPSAEFFAANARNCDVREGPKIHYGTILSGNGVIKTKQKRDELRDRFGGIAIEMEAAGMMTRLPVAVIRGISDFADSQKNDEWHAYAALVAAAYAKEIISRLGSKKETPADSRSVISPDVDACLSLSLPEQCRFVGRQYELAQLDNFLGFPQASQRQRSMVAVWGMSGVGKSQLVSEYVRRQRHRHPKNDIFWISGLTKETFEQSIMSLLKVSEAPSSANPERGDGYDEQRTVLINSFFTELRSQSRSSWLLVIDGVSSSAAVHQYIRRYLDTLPFGSVIFITRGKDVANGCPRRIEVKGLPEVSAAELLRAEIAEHLVERDQDILQLCSLLKYHPLSLTLAASVITNYPFTVDQYIEKWTSRKLDEEVMTADRALLQSFEVSFEELEKLSPLSAHLLMLFGYLDHKDLWYDLCANATDEDYPEWVHELAQTHFQHVYAPLRDFSFVEAKPHGRKKGFVYEIHPAIHEFSRWKARERGCEEQYVRVAISLVAEKVPRSSDPEFLSIAQRLEPHADQCKIYMEQNRGGVGIDLVELGRFGNLYRHLGRSDEAATLYQGILNVLRAEDEPCEMTQELTADIENNLGLVCHARRQYESAIEAFDRSYRMRLGVMMGGNSASMASVYNRGRSLMLLGRLEESVHSLQLAATYFSTPAQQQQQQQEQEQQENGQPINITNTTFTADPDTIITDDDTQIQQDEAGQIYYRILNDIGEIHLRNGAHDRAEASFKEAFAGQQRYLSASHPSTFAVRLNIGRVCVERMRFATARKIFEFIIDTYTHWWGRRHSETMRALAELADACMRHGELKRLMGEAGGGAEELGLAARLWGEVMEFHQGVYGAAGDTVAMAGAKLQSIRLLLNEPQTDDSYDMYYTS